eukprot:66013_1
MKVFNIGLIGCCASGGSWMLPFQNYVVPERFPGAKAVVNSGLRFGDLHTLAEVLNNSLLVVNISECEDSSYRGELIFVMALIQAAASFQGPTASVIVLTSSKAVVGFISILSKKLRCVNVAAFLKAVDIRATIDDALVSFLRGYNSR